MGGQEDVEAEGAEEGIEVRGGGWMEDWEGPWETVSGWRYCKEGPGAEGGGGGAAVPCFRRVGVVVKGRVWEMKRRRQGRQ